MVEEMPKSIEDLPVELLQHIFLDTLPDPDDPDWSPLIVVCYLNTIITLVSQFWRASAIGYNALWTRIGWDALEHNAARTQVMIRF